MNLKFPHSTFPYSVMAGATTITLVIIAQSTAFAAKSTKEIVQLANTITVQINEPPGSTAGSAASGSGFIVKKEGNTYTVLTCDHVVNPFKGPKPVNVRTNDGNKYPITGTTRSLGTLNSGVDLALLTFTSSNQYPVAKLGNSKQVKLGSEIFVYGYPANAWLNRVGEARVADFQRGSVWSIGASRNNGGYTMRYTAQTAGGMSGGPVFDVDGRVIGVHGFGETTEDIGDPQSGESTTIERKSGINAAVPVDAFLALQHGIDDLDVDQAPSTDKPDERIKNPQTPDVFVAIGLSKEANKAAAINNYTQAIRLDPNYSEAYYRRAIARYDQGDKQGAIADYSEAIRLNPNRAIAYYNRGIAFHNVRNYQSAITDFSQYLSFAPNDVSAYYVRGVTYRQLRDGRGTFADFDQIVRLDPTNAKSYFNRALARAMLSDKEGIVADFTEAIRLDPKYTEAYINRALVLRRLGNREGAIQDLTMVLQIQPDNGIAYYTRGLFRRDLGDLQGALADLETSLTIFQQKADTRSYQKAMEAMKKLQGAAAGTSSNPVPVLKQPTEQAPENLVGPI